LIKRSMKSTEEIKRSWMSTEEWRKSPENARNNPKLSPEDAKRIADEAIAGGDVWDVQEDINAHRRAERAAECGDRLD